MLRLYNRLIRRTALSRTLFFLSRSSRRSIERDIARARADVRVHVLCSVLGGDTGQKSFCWSRVVSQPMFPFRAPRELCVIVLTVAHRRDVHDIMSCSEHVECSPSDTLVFN